MGRDFNGILNQITPDALAIRRRHGAIRCSVLHRGRRLSARWSPMRRPEAFDIDGEAI